jgi:hypothetical protein
MCKDHNDKNTLDEGLKALRESGVIDSRLYEWSNSLRKERNIGAHAGEGNISADDARDVLDFAMAICEYVYVLADRYEKYNERKQKKAADSAGNS